MKISVSWIGWVLFAASLVVIFFLRSCEKPTTQVKIIAGDTKFVKGKTDTMWRDPKKVYIPKPGLPYPVSHEDTVYLPANPLTHADSLEAAAKFFNHYIYVDTLKGQQVVLALRDSIGENKILGRSFEIKNTRPIQQPILNPNKRKLFIGGQVGLSTTLKSAIVSPTLLYQTKQDALYSLSYDFFSKTPQIGLYFKIHIK